MRSSSEGKMWRVLALLCVMVLVVVACGSDDEGEDTTAAPGTTQAPATTAPQTGGGEGPLLYPLATGPPLTGSQPHTSLIDFEFADGSVGQPPCDDCANINQAAVGAGPRWFGAPEDDYPTSCLGPDGGPQTVSFVADQLIVTNEGLDFGDGFVGFIYPTLGPPEDVDDSDLTGEALDSYSLPDGYSIAVFAPGTDVVAELATLPPGEAALNHVYWSAPGWKFGPGTLPHKHDNSDVLLAEMVFSGGSIIVLDEFGSTDPIVGGHGEFIVALLSELTDAAIRATSALVPVSADLTVQGDVIVTGEIYPHQRDEVAIAAAARHMAARYPGSVLNLSLGTYSCFLVTDDGLTEYRPILLEQELIGLLAGTNTDGSRLSAVVAAAGNDSNPEDGPLFYPAAFDDVAGIGAAALSAAGDWAMAEFSNQRAYAWAPGVAIPAEVNGEIWQWSGTSFAAPIYAACVAARECPIPQED